MPHPNPARASLTKALVIAGLFLALSAALTLVSPAYLSPDMKQRVLGIAMGALVAFYGNVASKTLPPLARMRRDPALEQSARRFAAWTFTLGGVGYALAWVILPVDYAAGASASVLGFAMLLVLASWIRYRSRRVTA